MVYPKIRWDTLVCFSVTTAINFQHLNNMAIILDNLRHILNLKAIKINNYNHNRSPHEEIIFTT